MSQRVETCTRLNLVVSTRKRPFTEEFVKSTQNVDIWMEIPIHDVYIWDNFSASSYLNFIPLFWNVLILLKYDFMHIFMHYLSLYFDI
jgi:hypothetical protein